MRIAIWATALAIAAIAAGKPSGAGAADDIELPGHAPVPQWRDEALRQKPDAPERPASSESPALSADEKACRKALRTLKVTFAVAPAVEAKGGCALPHPIEVSTLSEAVHLEPPAVLNCETALAAARLLQTAGMAAAQKRLGARISAIEQDSAYVCRPINGSGNLSEHAFGNALDISAFVLSGGRRVAVKKYARRKSPEAEFLNDIRAAACGVFTTVLGPGTNADHARHFHFDMKRRRSAPYCR